MITQSDKAMAAWRATERVLDAVVTINKTDYKTSDIVSIEYDSGGYTGDTFGIGSNYENDVTIKFAHLVEGLKQGMEVTPKIGIKTSNGYEYSSLGVFIISDEITMDRNNDETSIKCYDRMCLLEGNYTSKLSYPAKVVDVIAEIANMAGAPLNTADISRLPALADLPSAIKGQTYRNAIGLIAQFYAGFATFGRDGKLTIRTIAEPDYTLDPSQYEQGGLTKNEAPYTIGGIQCEVTTTTTDSAGDSTDTTKTLQIGSKAGSQIKLTNDLMTADRMQTIWDAIGTLNFYPFSLNWFGNPAIEAGDWLTLQDIKGNKFNVPNNGYTMAFDGSLSAVSKADQTATASSSYVWKGELSQYVQALGGRQSATGNYIYGADTLYPPTNAKINDIWYKQNGNKIELWTFERQADGTGKWVLTVSDSTGEEIKQQVNSAVAETAKVAETANSAVAGANAAVAKAGFASDAASQAKSAAAIAGSDAKSALTSANSAVVTAGTASNNATAAYSKAGEALVSAGQALGQSNTALATANGAVGDVKLISETITQLKGGSTLSIAELENGMQSKVSKIEFDGMTTGAPNLILNSGKPTTGSHWNHNGTLSIVRHPFWKNGTENLFMLRTSGTTEVTMSSDYFAVTPGGTYALQLEAYRNANMSSMDVYFLGRKFGSSKTFDSSQLLISSDLLSTAKAIHREVTFTMSTDFDEGYIRVDNNGSTVAGANADLYVTDIKLAEESRASVWQPSPDDWATATDLSNLSGTVQIQTTTLQQTQGLLAAKADSVTVDGLRQTLSQTTATATATAKAMEAKVDSSVVDHLNSLVTKNINDIAITKDGMALKADVTVVNDLKKTVDSNSIAIGVANGQLALKAESSRVDAINKTVATNTADILANSKLVQSKLSQETFDNMQIGGRNYFLNSKYFEITPLGTANYDWRGLVISPDFWTNADHLKQDNIRISFTLQAINPLKAEFDSSFYFGQSPWYAGNFIYPSGTTKPIKIELKFSITDAAYATDGTFIRFQPKDTADFPFKLMQAKLEIGTRYTDWSAAPEDNASAGALNTLSGKVTTQSSLLQQTQTALLGKTDVSVVNSLTKTVQSNTNQIGINSKGLALKSNQSTVDTLTGRVSTAEGKMTVFGTQILQAVTKTDLTTTLGGYTTQSWTSGRIGAAADAVKISVAKVQSNLDGLQVGGTNLLQNSDFSSGFSTYQKLNVTAENTVSIEKDTDGTPMLHIHIGKPGACGVYSYTPMNNANKILSGDSWTVSALFKGTGHVSSFRIENSTSDISTFDLNTTTWQKRVAHGSKTSDGGAFVIYVNSGDVYVKLVKVEHGTKDTSWNLALEDQATATEFSSFETKYTGIQATVQNDVSGLKSQQTLLANQYTSVIGSITNSNIVPFSGYPTDTTGWTYRASAGGVGVLQAAKYVFYHSGIDAMFELINSGTDKNYASSSRFNIKANTTYTLTFKGFASSNVTSMDLLLLGRRFNQPNDDYTIVQSLVDKKRLSPYGVEWVTVTFKTGAIENAYLRFDNNGSNNKAAAVLFFSEIKIEEGSRATPYVHDGESSAMTQMIDAINLRVTKGSLMSQINLDAGHVLIQSNKLYLDASSVVFSGKAFIPAAQITDLRADYIKTGTLNGDTVNVINLNASSITTGTIHGTNLDINLNSGEVSFQRGRIHNTTNSIDINIDQGYISVANGDTRAMLKNGEIQLVQPTLFDTSSNPYGRIFNGGGAGSLVGMTISGRNQAVVTNASNDTWSFPVSSVNGNELFSGLATGMNNGKWLPTKVAGAERGVVISGGAHTTWSTWGNNSPYILVGSKGTTGSDWNGPNIYMDCDYLYIPTVQHHTSSHAANMYVADDGAIVRASSAAKYKANIDRSFSTDYGSRLLDIPIATWLDKAELQSGEVSNPSRYFGMIAEDLAAAGLEMLVDRDANGELEGIEYDRIAVALLPLIKKQQEEINELKQKLEAS